MKTYRDQSGIVSIFVTMLLIVIMSLMVLAFAQVSRREQRESLDSQLSSQAYYAAETGVNDAKTAIVDFLNNNPGVDLPQRKVCNDGSNYSSLSDPANMYLNIDKTVGYTCVTIDPTPPSLSGQVGDDDLVLPIEMATPNTAVGSLKISWTGSSNGAPVSAAQMNANCAGNGSFPVASSYANCTFGGLRFDLVPVDTSVSRSSLITNTMTGFLMPRKANGSGTVAYKTGAVSQGIVGDATSCTTGTCTVTITGLTAKSYYMRLSKLYLPSNITMTATGGDFKNAQAAVDSTGRAQDVLRRVLVAVPLQSTDGSTPNSALISGDSVCKRFEIYSGFIAQGFTGTFPGSDDNPLCAPISSGSDSSSSTGDAQFTNTDPNGSGGVVTGNGGPYFGRTYYNISDNPDFAVTSCLWNWGDGTTSTTACHYGDSIKHTYPTTTTCVRYNIVLTIQLNNGVTPPPYTQTVSEPHGSASVCATGNTNP